MNSLHRVSIEDMDSDSKSGNLQFPSIFSHPRYLGYHSAFTGDRAHYLVSETGELVVPTVKVPHNPLKRRIGRVDFIDPFLTIPAGRLTFVTRFGISAEACRSIYRRSVLRILRVRFYPSDLDSQEARKVCESFGMRISETQSSIIDLGIPSALLYKSLEKRHRYALRNALGMTDQDFVNEKAMDAISPRIENDVDMNFESFPKLWSETFDRMRSKNASQDNIFTGRMKLMKEYCESGLLRIIGIHGNDRIEAIAILFIIKDRITRPTAFYSVGASSQAGRDNGLPLLLQWHIIGYLKSIGIKIYDLGGMEPGNMDHGPSLFKSGFNGKEVKGFDAMSIPPLLKVLVRN